MLTVDAAYQLLASSPELPTTGPEPLDKGQSKKALVSVSEAQKALSSLPEVRATNMAKEASDGF